MENLRKRRHLGVCGPRLRTKYRDNGLRRIIHQSRTAPTRTLEVLWRAAHQTAGSSAKHNRLNRHPATLIHRRRPSRTLTRPVTAPGTSTANPRAAGMPRPSNHSDAYCTPAIAGYRTSKTKVRTPSAPSAAHKAARRTTLGRRTPRNLAATPGAPATGQPGGFPPPQSGRGTQSRLPAPTGRGGRCLPSSRRCSGSRL